MNKLGKNKMLVYGLVLAAAVLGLIIDRLGRSEPAASAETYAVARPAGGPGAKPAAATAGEPVSGPAIARVFERSELQTPNSAQSRPAAGPLTVNLPLFGAVRIPGRETGRNAGSPLGRDAFDMLPKMRLIYEEPTPEMQALEQQKRESLREQRRQEIARFQSTHQLRGTTLDGKGSWAMINDRIVHVGQKLDGFQLKRVERYHVVLTADDMEIVLSLPMPY